MPNQDPSSETLTHRLARGALPLADLLTYAMDVAVALRDLHNEGRAHGSVGTESIWVEHGSATLSPASARAPVSTPAADIPAFGAVLQSMLDALDASGPMDARAKLRELRAWCRGGPGQELPGMQSVIVELRLAGMMARKNPAPAHLPAEPLPASINPPSYPTELPSMPIPDYATPASFFGSPHGVPAAAPSTPPESPAVRSMHADTGQVSHKAATHPLYRCPRCGSLDTRETPSRPLLHRLLAFAGVTYRCRACQARFLARRPWTPPPEE